jgi:hypothetical protein
MVRFFIGLGIVTAVLALAVQPCAAQVQRAILGDDDLPNGAPIQRSAAAVKRVCYVGPANPTPNCIFDTIAQCRAECRTKRLHRGMRGRVQCMINPALQQRPPARPASLQGNSVAAGLYQRLQFLTHRSAS